MKKRDAKASQKNEKPKKKKDPKRVRNQHLAEIRSLSQFGVFNDPIDNMYSGLFDNMHVQKKLDVE